MAGILKIGGGYDGEVMNTDSEFIIEQLEDIRDQMNEYYGILISSFPHYLMQWWTYFSDDNERRDFVNHIEESRYPPTSIVDRVMRLMEADGISIQPSIYLREEFNKLFKSQVAASMEAKLINSQFQQEWMQCREKFFYTVEEAYRKTVEYVTR